MQITIDTDNAKDLEILQAMVGALNGNNATAVATKKTTAAKKTAAAPAPEQTPEEPEAGVTLDDAVKLATEMVADGKATEVKAALAQFDADRVSKLDPGHISGFIAALS